MSKAMELIDYLVGIEAQNTAALLSFPTTSDEAKDMAVFFGQQAAKKTVAYAQLRKIVQDELGAAAASKTE